MARKLYMCVVQNHPWATPFSYWEEEAGMVQEVKMRRDDHYRHIMHFDGYVGLMFPFEELADACVLVDYGDETRDEVGVLSSKVKRLNSAEQTPNWNEESIDEP